MPLFGKHRRNASTTFEPLEGRLLMSVAPAEVSAAAPPTPLEVDAVLIAPRAARVTWADVAGETGYRVERRVDGSSDPWVAVARTAPNVVTVTNDGLLLGRTYLYRVVAFNEAGESAPSKLDFVNTPNETDLPPVPGDLRAELIAPRAIKLTWNDVAGETGYVIERRIDGSPEAFARVGSTNAGVTTFTDDGLLAGKTYLYRVRSVNAVGTSGPSNVAFATTPREDGPTAPVAPRLEASLAGERAIRLNWTNVANETGYRIERRVDGSPEPFREIAATGADVTTYTDDGLEPGKTYIYRVRAFNAAGNSEYSNTAFRTISRDAAAPATPTDVAATLIAPRAARVTWDDVVNERGYRIERRVDGSAEEWRVVGTVGANVTSFAQDGLLAGKTYLYRVRAFNDAGASEPSSAASVRTPDETPVVPAAPRLEASLAGPRAIRLNWTNVAGETGYRVERRVDGSTDPFREIARTGADVTTSTDDALEPGKTYLYRVRAFNAAGNSVYSNTVNRTISRDTSVPSAPTNVAATLIGPRAVRVTWSRVDNARGYRIERVVEGTGEGWRVVGTVGADASSFTQDGLMAGKTYVYRVRAFNDAGTSAPSEARSVRTPAEQAVPSAPHLEATVLSGRAVRLAWTNVSNESGYKVERRVDGTDQPYRQIFVTGDEVTRYVDDGLEPGKTYIYRVRAFNSAGNSDYSNRVAVTTPRAGGVVGTGSGLLGTYFDNADLTNPRLTRVDPTVNFEWGAGSPAPVIGADTFSVRWAGQVQAQFTETYRFYTRTDDGVRLWVNGRLLIDDWNHHAVTERAESIALEAGRKYSLKLEYFENGGNATARLLWSSPSTAKQVVPKSQLYAATSETAPAPRAATAAVKVDGGAHELVGDRDSE